MREREGEREGRDHTYPILLLLPPYVLALLYIIFGSLDDGLVILGAAPCNIPPSPVMLL